MKTKSISVVEKTNGEIIGSGTISFKRAREIMLEEGIEYTDEELKEVLDFISKVVTISTNHYERLNEKKAKIISINTNHPHETKSISLHQSKYGRTG